MIEIVVCIADDAAACARCPMKESDMTRTIEKDDRAGRGQSKKKSDLRMKPRRKKKSCFLSEQVGDFFFDEALALQ